MENEGAEGRYSYFASWVHSDYGDPRAGRNTDDRLFAQIFYENRGSHRRKKRDNTTSDTGRIDVVHVLATIAEFRSKSERLPPAFFVCGEN